ncbi:MAG: pyruvate flavodoxin/ferredoxin oxidoreductase [Desulfobacterales bacterium]|nr:pyruvate flavodoxin/ferredoxin oxidoreductase [Desulfobacterales bacterium]
MGKILMEGNEAIAQAAMAAGCRFFAGYPITPATTIFNQMLSLLPPAGGVCLQGEDEIASIGYCLGASMAGMKAMTATSGPGISLYSEQISFAIGSEIPLVIVNVQRLGPSTGSATRGADGDIQFMRWGNTGGLPVIVLAPSDVKDCYLLTQHAFNLAERYRCPVFVASNKEIAMTRESVDLDRLQGPTPVWRERSPGDRPYLPFDTPQGRTVPWFEPIGGRIISRQTSSTHGPDGYITTDPEVIGAINTRLMEKLSSAVSDFAHHEAWIEEDADTLVITYGVTARAARDAFFAAKQRRRPFSLLVLKTLWPVPVDLIRSYAANARRIVVAEMNLGQYVREIQRVLPGVQIDFLGQMNGKMITPRQIERSLADDQPSQ